MAPALRPQFCLHYNSGLVWPKKTWLAGRIASFALLVVELCPVAYRATAGANFAAFPTYQQRLHWLRAPNNTCLSRPDPPTLSLRRWATQAIAQPGRTALERLETAEERLKETGKALLPREAAQRHQQGRSTQRSGPAQPSQGRFGAAPQAWPTCGQPAPSQMRAGGRGAGGLGADWAAGAVGSRAGCAAGRPLCAREGKRGRAGGR